MASCERGISFRASGRRSTRSNSLCLLTKATTVIFSESEAAQDKSQLAEIAEHEPNNTPATANSVEINSTVKGSIAAPDKDGSADADLFRFHAKKGEQLVLEIKAARSKS